MREYAILTVYPEYFRSPLEVAHLRRGREAGFFSVKIVNLKQVAEFMGVKVDGRVYGGGEGMVLRADVIGKALEGLEGFWKVLLSPDGTTLTQNKLRDLSEREKVAFVCGRFEGVDARVEELVDEAISVGDYVVLGGEAPCLLILEGVVRLIPGLIRELSHRKESFETGMLDHPVYTKPREYKGKKVPEVLLSGDHELVEAYRLLKAVERTLERRPDLLKGVAKDIAEILKRKGVVKNVGIAGEDNVG